MYVIIHVYIYIYILYTYMCISLAAYTSRLSCTPGELCLLKQSLRYIRDIFRKSIPSGGLQLFYIQKIRAIFGGFQLVMGIPQVRWMLILSCPTKNG